MFDYTDIFVSVWCKKQQQQKKLRTTDLDFNILKHTRQIIIIYFYIL